MTMTIDFGCPALFLATARFASDEQTRYYLRGVYVERVSQGGLLYTATDGHRLLQAYDEDARMTGPDAVIVGVEKPKFSASWFKCPWMKWDGEKLETDRGDMLKTVAVDGAFPDYTYVIPKAASGQVAQFNADYLADFAAVGKMGKFGVPHIHHNGYDPALVSFFDKRLFGVLMPLRQHGTDAAVPVLPKAKGKE